MVQRMVVLFDLNFKRNDRLKGGEGVFSCDFKNFFIADFMFYHTNIFYCFSNNLSNFRNKLWILWL